MLIPFADTGGLLRLLDAVQRAPSVRESQPWSFRIVASDRLELRANQDRWLKIADPRARGLTISCGAALFNLRMAIRVTGHNVAVWLLPDPAQDPDLLASVEIVTGRTLGPAATDQELYDAIMRRRTNRSPFTGPPIAAKILVTMQVAAAKEQGWLRLLDRPATKRWLRAADDAQRKLATHTLYQDELSRLAPDYLMLSRAGAPLPSSQVERRPQLMVLSTDYDRPLDWLRAGQALQRALLTGTPFGVVASFLTQPLELPDLPGSTQAVLPRLGPWNWPRAEVPQMVLRVGYAAEERDDVFRPQLPNVSDTRPGPDH
jgi:nitroreductase